MLRRRRINQLLSLSDENEGGTGHSSALMYGSKRVGEEDDPDEDIQASFVFNGAMYTCTNQCAA